VIVEIRFLRDNFILVLGIRNRSASVIRKSDEKNCKNKFQKCAVKQTLLSLKKDVLSLKRISTHVWLFIDSSLFWNLKTSQNFVLFSFVGGKLPHVEFTFFSTIPKFLMKKEHLLQF
jgi:hypothetical protein